MAVTVDSSGDVFVADPTGIWELTPQGSLNTLTGGLSAPRGMTFDANGNLLFTETGTNLVRRLTPSGTLTTIAGDGTAGFAGDGSLATSAQLNEPSDVAIDSNGVVWIADSGNNRVRTLAAAIAAPETTGATIVNAASMAAGPIAPGEIVTIFGSGFDPAKTQLLFDGKPATVFFANATQINALAPAALAPNSNTDASIVVDGVTAADWLVPVTSAAPGLFTVGNGTGQAAANNEDGSINSASNPAARGSVVSLWATGQGSDLTAVSVTVAGYAADVLYAGPAPGFQGLMQINARVPAGFLPPGIQPVLLSVGAAQSQPGVTLAIR
jgi:uncharacterized protein (TIGR03437 family)